MCDIGCVGAAAQTLEVDVVVDLLLVVGRCFGERDHQWSRVLLWFEGVAARCGAASFSFVTSMLSAEQKRALSAVLDLVAEHIAERGASCGEEDGSDEARTERMILKGVRSVYELSN